MFPMPTCPICGAAIGDQNRHIAWHMVSGDVENAWTCPLDGSPTSFSANDGRRIQTQWVCGHGIDLPIPAPVADPSGDTEGGAS